MGTLTEGPWNVPDSISESNRDNYTAEGLTSELSLVWEKRKSWALYCLQRLKEKTLQGFKESVEEL